jgi:hypothetical protein
MSENKIMFGECGICDQGERKWMPCICKDEPSSDKLIEQIMSQREKILEAFIAETGLLPSQCQQVVQDGKWWVEKRK